MSAPAAPVLEARGLSLKIGRRDLCRQLELSLHAGECLVLLGPNGAGKTTLLHTLAGLHEPTAGTVRLLGSPYAARSARDNARIRGLLPQSQPDPFSGNVIETVLVGRHPHLGRWAVEGPNDLALARAALESLGLAGMEHRTVHSLSGGERQRVAIAALLAQAPTVFLLDEPLNHLDLHHQIATLELFRSLCRSGRAVAMVLHDINLAARYADQVILLDGRGGADAGAASTVLQAERLSQAFAHPLRRFEVGTHTTFIPD